MIVVVLRQFTGHVVVYNFRNIFMNCDTCIHIRAFCLLHSFTRKFSYCSLIATFFFQFHQFL